MRLDCWVTCSVRFPGDVESALRHPLFRILDIGHSRQVDDVSEAGERHPPTFSGRGHGGGNASEATRFGEGGTARKVAHRSICNLVIVFHYFPKRVLSDLVYQLRYESPYGQSSRCSVLDRLARFDLALEEQVAGFVGQYLLQFVLDERELVIQSDGSWQTRSGR